VPSPVAVRTVGVIVVCHNYGRFLAEALDSVLAQSRPVNEILVVDDRSDDNTADIAREFIGLGVKYLHVDAGNVHLARKAGFEHCKCDVLCFLDADDKLHTDYIGRGLAEFTSYRVAIVYSDVEHFDAKTGHSSYSAQFSRDRLQVDNYFHAGSLVRREALELSRAFEHVFNPVHTQGDWFLWKRLLEDNWIARKQQGTYFYRQHATNWTFKMREVREYFGYAGLRYEDVTLYIPLSGRREAWSRLQEFLERQQWPHQQVRLVLLDTSQDDEFFQLVRGWVAGCDYPDVRHFRYAVGAPGLADADRYDLDVRSQVRLAVARIYNRMLSLVETEYVWILEDDVTPPDDAGERLLKGFDFDVVSVAAPYRSRYQATFVVWDREGASFNAPGTGLQTVGGNGFGCTILRRSVLREHVFTAELETPDYDTAFYRRLRGTKWVARVDWSCLSEHAGVPAVPPVVAVPAMTPCECAAAGFCPRHHCRKTPHWHMLCQTRPDYFRLWEEGRGPGQHLAPPPENGSEGTVSDGPGLLQKAVNFSKAIVRHARDGGREVEDTVYEQRLGLCRQCPSCDREQMVCRERTCGCFLKVKARWHSEACPLGKWPDLSTSNAGTAREITAVTRSGTS
jgi:cellulose synthase/poly-beta-1,6-N-acetylglucosamine synthase-like glycosyltransferase